MGKVFGSAKAAGGDSGRDDDAPVIEVDIDHVEMDAADASA